MTILSRYIGRTVILASVLVMAVMLSVYTFLSFVDELRDVGKGNYDLHAATEFVLLTLPGRIYDLFPACALLGTLLGLGWLASTSELIAMRAAGLSIASITTSVMRVGVALMLALILFGELVAPVTEQYAQAQRSIAISGHIALMSRLGFWVRDKLTFINIRQILPGVRLGDIYIYEFNDQRRLVGTAHAAEASYIGKRWLLKDIALDRIEDDGVITTRIPQAAWETLLSPDLINVVVVDPQKLSAIGLYRYINYLRDNHQDASRYQLALWIRIMAPISTGVMVFLAVPFVFGSLRTMGAGQRTVIGAMVGLAFFLLNRTLSYLGLAYDLNPFFSAAFPTLLFLGLAIWLMRRAY